MVEPDRGGRIASLTVGGLELLCAEDADPMRWGSYPMVPYAGRVRRGRFDFAGRTHTLPIDLPPHAIHGTTLRRAWRAEGASDRAIRLSIDLGADWPFPGRAVQEIALDDGALRVRLEVHSDGEPFPASLGLHPWFRREIGRGAPLALDFRARSLYERDADGIPTGRLVEPRPRPWDDCFTDLEADPVLEWAGALRLRLSSSHAHWVVYDEPAHAICVEPMTGPPDALNIAPTVVEPGRPLALEASIAWEES